MRPRRKNLVMIAPMKREEFQKLILGEDADLLVLNKPAGVPLHGDRYHDESQTLLAAALDYLNVTESAEYKPAFAHRLDHDTSGVVVMAKTHEALASFHRQTKLKQVRKTYLALLLGEIREKGAIHWALEKQMDRRRWLALMRPVRRGGIRAHTDYRRLELFYWDDLRLSLVEATPRTGRTHQLRAHFAAVKYPIAGDDLYGWAEKNERLRKELGITRQMLHAIAIEFTHPTTAQTVRYEAPMPDDFRAALEKLKAASTRS